ncbi:class I SAM-dependent DNA methyltransferase [Ornithinibacillus scapharcae]|uniref:class I SAM-dependent DNA methyltransferase n=1 Tax=Ornithinibacillus scapharcae TaxID=1147159 RepID=UPI000225B7CB|nr:class I SAM-dependent methyltransferase [Ornithinibacillus scapharcae]
MAYQLMAKVYDQFMAEAPYDKWVTFTEEILNRYNLNNPAIVDLGCGTGEITVELAKKYDVTGVDYSSDMLTIAEQKAGEHQVKVKWIHQDIRELTGISNIDLAISYCDVINYITTVEEVHTVFRSVREALKDDGLFIFDVHSLRHVEENLIGNTFSDVTENSAYIWDCFAGKDQGEMFHELTFFASNGDTYSRFDETHHQQTFSLEVYREILENTGFEILSICADFSIENGFSEEEAERIFIIAQKQDEID